MSVVHPSCSALATSLPLLVQEMQAAEHVWMRAQAGSARKVAKEEAWKTTAARLRAVEDLVLASPAVTLPDTVVQVVLAASRLRTMRDVEEAAEADLVAAERGLHSVLAVLLPAASMTLDPVTLRYYLPFATIPNLQEVVPLRDPEPGAAVL